MKLFAQSIIQADVYPMSKANIPKGYVHVREVVLAKPLHALIVVLCEASTKRRKRGAPFFLENRSR